MSRLYGRCTIISDCSWYSFQLVITLVCGLGLSWWKKHLVFLLCSSFRVSFNVAWTLLRISQYVSLSIVLTGFQILFVDDFATISPDTQQKLLVEERSSNDVSDRLTRLRPSTFIANIVAIHSCFTTSNNLIEKWLFTIHMQQFLTAEAAISVVYVFLESISAQF